MAKPATIVILLAFTGISYWYWTGPYENSANTDPVDNPRKNAELMAKCVVQEKFAIEDGNRAQGADPEELCADKYGLTKFNGEWHH